MPYLEELKKATSLSDVARLLRFSPSGLSFILYKTSAAAKYTTFDIQKKSGGVRTIAAPLDPLKAVQRNLSDLLYACRAEIEKKSKRRILSFGFQNGLSIFENAKAHRSRRFVLNLDIQDFFPSFNFGRVRGFFLKDRDFELNEKVATILAQIACHANSLPQGSPCSPIISDMIAHILDRKIVHLCKLQTITYSRYADDLTFSTNKRAFPEALAVLDDTTWRLGEDLTRTITKCGFLINHQKTRMQVRSSRQTVTGLTVNVKVNVSQVYYKRARSMCHSLFNSGAYHQQIVDVPSSTVGTPPIFKMISSIYPLEGILSHIYHIRRKNLLSSKGHFEPENIPAKSLFSKFIFYKYFVSPDKPLIICEGKTDNVYLRHAIRRLKAIYPSLGADTSEGFRMGVRLFRYTPKISHLLNLAGGSSFLPDFISEYGSKIKSFNYRPMPHPVIILIDNDAGATGVFSLLKKKFKINCGHGTTLPYYHVVHNLFIVKTPEIPPNNTSCIESLFDPTIKATLINGKKFNPENNLDKATEYGKAIFADRVVTPNAATINWSQFPLLLDRLVAVLSGYVPPIIVGSPSSPPRP